MGDVYDPDDVGLLHSPLLSPIRPNLHLTPSPSLSDDLKKDDFISDGYMADEDEFSLHLPFRVNPHRLNSRRVALQQDAELINFLGGGNAMDAARTAATELLASDDEILRHYSHMDGRAAAHIQPGIDLNSDLAALALGALKGMSNKPFTVPERSDEFAALKENSLSSKKSSSGLRLPSITEQLGHLTQTVEADTVASPYYYNNSRRPSQAPDRPPHLAVTLGDYTSSSMETPRTDSGGLTPAYIPLGDIDRISIDSITNPNLQIGGFLCTYPSCNAQPFRTQYLLNSHANVHSQNRPHYCPVKGCFRGKGGKGFKRKNEMIRHALVHESPGYVCPYCKDRECKYPRPVNLQRHVRVYHVDKDKDDPLLREALCERPTATGMLRRRRRHGGEYDVAVQTATKDQGDGRSQIKIKDIEPSLDLSSVWEGEVPEFLSSLRAKVTAVEPQQISSTQPTEWSSTGYTGANEGRQVWRQETKGLDSTCIDDENNEPKQEEQHFIGASDDIPFTDSGYSSLRNNLNHHSSIPSSLEKSQCLASTEQSISMNDGDGDGDDAKTSYSAATTVGPVHAQNYVTELCADIYGKLRKCFDSKLWGTVSRALPVLIKAFAIKIGHESSAQVNQEIMYFLHRRHGQVFTQLEAMFQREDDVISDSPRAERKGMSLNEKMSMWDSRAGEDQPVSEADDLYQGVKDDEDDITDLVDLPVYHKIILNSAAYGWFLAGLRKEINLQWSASQPRVMVESVRRRILDQLPTGTISKRRALGGNEVKFDLQWGDKYKGWLEHENFGQLIRSDQSFAELITVTGSAEEAQALTIKQYLSQTWPASGPQLLDVLRNTINSRYHHYSGKITTYRRLDIGNTYADLVILLDNTQLEARINGSHMTITATGPAHFIAECGEQLAWLQAALSSNSRHYASYCTPSILSYWINPSPSDKLNYEGYCKIGLESAHPASPGDPVPRIQNCWQDLVRINIIIAGFPISRRPENYPGLELSFVTFLDLLKAENTTITNGSVLLRGQNKTVQLMKYSDNVFFWHPLHSEDQGCSCCAGHHVGLDDVLHHSPLDLHILNAGRHIFSDCADLQTAVGENSPKAIYAQNCVSTEANPVDSLSLGHNQPATGRNESLSALPEYQHDMAFLSLSVSSIFDRSVSADGPPSFQKNYPEIDSLLGDANLLAADSQPIVTTRSPNDSLESDFLSMSDSSEQIEPLDSSEPAYPLLNTLLQELLLGFRSTTQGQLSPSENGESSVTQPTATASSNATSNSIQCRKRNREREDDDEVSEDGFRKPPRKRINPSQGKAPQRTLACPYLKLDPITHRECCKYQLSRIRDVKQHLHRQHTPEFYCQRCFKTDFLDQQSLQDHVSLGICSIEDPVILEGISNQQQKRLTRKSDRSLSEEDQWFAIWTILFPRVLRPISAYMDTSVSEDMRLFREYCLTRGPSALEEQIESNPAWLGADITAEQRQIHLNRVIVQGINSLFEGYLRSIPFPDSIRDRRASPSRQLNHSLQPTRLATPTSSNTDSGVTLGSQLSSSDTTSNRGLLHQPHSIVEFNYQMESASNRVQGTPTIQGLVAEPSLSHGQNLLDPALDRYFDDQLLGAEWPTFDEALDFDTISNLDFWSQFDGASNK